MFPIACTLMQRKLQTHYNAIWHKIKEWIPNISVKNGMSDWHGRISRSLNFRGGGSPLKVLS